MSVGSYGIRGKSASPSLKIGARLVAPYIFYQVGNSFYRLCHDFCCQCLTNRKTVRDEPQLHIDFVFRWLLGRVCILSALRVLGKDETLK